MPPVVIGWKVGDPCKIRLQTPRTVLRRAQSSDGGFVGAIGTSFLINGLGQRIAQINVSVPEFFFVYDEAGHLIGKIRRQRQSSAGDGVARRFADRGASALRRYSPWPGGRQYYLEISGHHRAACSGQVA